MARRGERGAHLPGLGRPPRGPLRAVPDRGVADRDARRLLAQRRGPYLTSVAGFVARIQRIYSAWSDPLRPIRRRGAAGQGRFEWACFIAHQAGEKAVKAVHEAGGTEAWGHSVAGLLSGLDAVPPEIVDAGKALDRHYVPTRYPNAQPEGAPGDLYTERDATLALEDAEKVIEHARSRIQNA